MKVGIYDSGIGGISVLHEACRMLQNVEYIFYADTDHVPYGLKTREEILSYSSEIVRFLIEKNVDAVVIACNTATAVAASELREEFDIPIIGMEPAVKPAVQHNHDGKRILVMATPVTIRENKLHHLLEEVDKSHEVDLLPMPGLVSFAEQGIFDGSEVESYLSEQLEGYALDKYSALVLGCTHFNYFKPLYRKFFAPETELIDGNSGTVRRLASITGAALRKEIMTSCDDMASQLHGVVYYTSGRLASDEMLRRIDILHERLEEVYFL